MSQQATKYGTRTIDAPVFGDIAPNREFIPLRTWPAGMKFEDDKKEAAKHSFERIYVPNTNFPYRSTTGIP